MYILNLPYRVERARLLRKGMIVLKLEGVDDINRAELLRDLYVEVKEKDLPPTEEGEFYVYRLLGLKVLTEDGEVVGKVVDMHEWAPYWTFEVETPEGKRIYIPFVSEYVKEVEPEEGVIVVRLPEGYVSQF